MKRAIILSGLLVSIVGIFSYYQYMFVPYLVIFSITLITILITMDKIKDKQYSVYLFAIALSLLWQTSMLGVHIIGADIHSEFSVANQTIQEGWIPSFVNPNNTSILIVWITPLLDKLGLDVVWQFKALYPIFLAVVPVILYLAYRKMIGSKRSFYAALFFVIVPVFSLEIITIAKSMVAEVFLALMVLFTVANIRLWKKTVGLGICVVLATLIHYTIGMIAILFLIGGFVIWLLVKLIRMRLFRNTKLFPKGAGIALVSLLAVTVLWYSNIAGGAILTTYRTIIRAYSSYIIPSVQVGETPKPFKVPGEGSVDTPVKPKDTSSYLNRQEPLVKLAIGLDFPRVSLEAKIFRILQYITQLMIVAGFIYLIVRKSKYQINSDYLIFTVASFGLLVLCIFLPYFSSTINITRFYHVTLFFLAPMLVIGVEEISFDSGRILNWLKMRLS